MITNSSVAKFANVNSRGLAKYGCLFIGSCMAHELNTTNLDSDDLINKRIASLWDVLNKHLTYSSSSGMNILFNRKVALEISEIYGRRSIAKMIGYSYDGGKTHFVVYDPTRKRVFDSGSKEFNFKLSLEDYLKYIKRVKRGVIYTVRSWPYSI